MLEEEKKVDETLKVETEEDIAKVKEEIKKEVLEDNSLSEEQQALFEKVLEEASMPVEMSDADFKLGANELDIRKLNKKNLAQMMFREGVLNIVYGKQILSTLVDILRLMMVIADKLGVENIPQATDDVIEKTVKQNKELKKTIDDIKEDA